MDEQEVKNIAAQAAKEQMEKAGAVIHEALHVPGPTITTSDELITALQNAIADSKDARMSAVMGRIPLLCESVLQIHLILKEIKEKQVTVDVFTPVKNLVYGGVALILVGFMGGLIYLVFHSHP